MNSYFELLLSAGNKTRMRGQRYSMPLSASNCSRDTENLRHIPSMVSPTSALYSRAEITGRKSASPSFTSPCNLLRNITIWFGQAEIFRDLPDRLSPSHQIQSRAGKGGFLQCDHIHPFLFCHLKYAPSAAIMTAASTNFFIINQFSFVYNEIRQILE